VLAEADKVGVLEAVESLWPHAASSRTVARAALAAAARTTPVTCPRVASMYVFPL
jgi:hypothetical protein